MLTAQSLPLNIYIFIYIYICIYKTRVFTFNLVLVVLGREVRQEKEIKKKTNKKEQSQHSPTCR